VLAQNLDMVAILAAIVAGKANQDSYAQVVLDMTPHRGFAHT
jgi:hypothetical protein